MSFVQGIRRAGARRNALGQIAFFHSSSPLHVKWRSKYKNKTGYVDEDNGHKKFFLYERRKQRASQKRELLNWRRNITFEEITEGSYTQPQKSSRHRNNKSMPNAKKTNDWEAYLKYEGDWDKFCKKFMDFADFEPERPRSRSRRGQKKGYSSWNEWDFDDEEEDDGWDCDDPAFGSRKSKFKSEAKHVTIIGQRADRLALGLPPAGSLKIEDVKAAFRASALKWHPDRHDGSSKDMAEEKFKACGNAYRALCTALAESNQC